MKVPEQNHGLYEMMATSTTALLLVLSLSFCLENDDNVTSDY